ncbi:hypothetical protein SKAU_G00227680 [Synaphobranchus kaupii]|uniref:Uncharacterized protein n=1 Tax=Synaphobranchus kaupii TaxID=118154 RepID=A0A9Q1F4Z3_SYNKA|nr:hypothetical protein SKAU_G00227680 [Synaphobranchus kaupii]
MPNNTRGGKSPGQTQAPEQGQIVGEPSVIDKSKFPVQQPDKPGQSYLSLVLLALTAGLSGSIYICVMRYICTGCCKPVVVGPHTENITGEV